MARLRLIDTEKLTRTLEELYSVVGLDTGVVKGNQLNPSVHMLLLEYNSIIIPLPVSFDFRLSLILINRIA